MRMRKMELLVLLLAVSLIAGAANADITDGLVGYWPFEYGSGDTAYDSSGSVPPYNGTLIDTPIWNTGPEGFGDALLFDVGSSDGVYCGTECDPGNVFTLAIWAYWLDSTYEGAQIQHFMTKSDGWTPELSRWQWELHANAVDTANTDKIRIACKSHGGITLSASTLPANEWVHLAVTFDGTDATLFVNGVEDPMGPVAFAIDGNTTAKFVIGNANNYSRGFDGYLDEARAYSRVLDPAEIQGLLVNDRAVNIEPKNGEPVVAVNTNLSWGPPPAFTPSKYDLRYKVGDPNFAIGATTVVVEDIVPTGSCNVHPPAADFATEVTVYWRVDSYTSSYPDPCIGYVWSFTTGPLYPVITEDPRSLTVAAGDTAVFRVEDVNGTDYTWKKQTGNVTVGGNSPVLTLTDVQKDPCEDFYRCIVQKSGQPDATSAWAGLWTRRRIAHWDFNDNLNDSEGDWPGDYVDPNEDSHPAVYASGIVGQALQLANDPCHVLITGSEEFFNFYPQGYTANVWIKTAQSGWGALACKQFAGGGLGWVVYCGDGDIWNGLRDFSSVASDVDINDGLLWHMVTATYDAEAGVLTTYVDGEPAGSDTKTNVALTNVYPVLLGTEHPDGLANSYEGLLDNVGIYSYALSPVDVAVLYTEVMGGEICVGGNPENDLSGDCRVDLEDFAILATNWLKCNLVPVSLCP